MRKYKIGARISIYRNAQKSIERSCLKCDRKFYTYSKFIRSCDTCKIKRPSKSKKDEPSELTIGQKETVKI